MRGLFAVVFLIACGADAGPEPLCPPLPETCSPQYPATFDSVFINTLKTSCGVGGNSCHAGPTPQAGLGLDDADRAYFGLLEGELVVPNDPACSPLIQRLNHDNPNLLMPPGMALPPSEICAIRQWIEAGAPR